MPSSWFWVQVTRFCWHEKLQLVGSKMAAGARALRDSAHFTQYFTSHGLFLVQHWKERNYSTRVSKKNGGKSSEIFHWLTSQSRRKKKFRGGQSIEKVNLLSTDRNGDDNSMKLGWRFVSPRGSHWQNRHKRFVIEKCQIRSASKMAAGITTIFQTHSQKKPRIPMKLHAK